MLAPQHLKDEWVNWPRVRGLGLGSSMLQVVRPDQPLNKSFRMLASTDLAPEAAPTRLECQTQVRHSPVRPVSQELTEKGAPETEPLRSPG